MKNKIKQWLKRVFHIHKYEYVGDSGFYEHYICKKCGDTYYQSLY